MELAIRASGMVVQDVEREGTLESVEAHQLLLLSLLERGQEL